ncbi:MAG: hypothetical protein QNK23_13815 [Crocinitomicaceae bacterium]|nr:hypothetical protein [Crocinitomicaceae bacterium]
MTDKKLFIRNYLGQTPDSLTTNGVYNSPDIICSGDTPIGNPHQITGKDAYENGTPDLNDQVPAEKNYVYVRGLNPTNSKLESTIFLFYCKPSVILWPQNWKNAGIGYKGNQEQNGVHVIASENEITSTKHPYKWELNVESIPYSLIVWPFADAGKNDPLLLPEPKTLAEMSNFLLDNPELAIKSTIEVDSSQPTIHETVPIVGPAEGGILNIGVVCKGIPPGGYLQFSVQGPDPANSINFPKTLIPIVGYTPTIQVKWSAGFDSTMEISYWKEDTTPPDGASLNPIVGFMESSSDENKKLIDRAKTEAPNQLAKSHFYGSPENLNKSTDSLDSVPIQTLYLLGMIAYVLKDMSR